jgi:hypothetical protein
VGIVFGHALYEGLVLGVRAMAARVVVATIEELPSAPAGWVELADRVLEDRLRSEELAPNALPRVALAELSGVASA